MANTAYMSLIYNHINHIQICWIKRSKISPFFLATGLAFAQPCSLNILLLSWRAKIYWKSVSLCKYLHKVITTFVCWKIIIMDFATVSKCHSPRWNLWLHTTQDDFFQISYLLRQLFTQAIIFSGNYFDKSTDVFNQVPRYS